MAPAARPRSTSAANRNAASDTSPALPGARTGFMTGLAPRFAAADLPARLCCTAVAVLRDDIKVLSLLHDLIFAQLEAPVRDTLAGLHVVFVAVPRTHEMQFLLGEIEPARRLVGHDALFDLGDGEAFACRPALVEAVIAVGVELALVAKHADLGIAEENDPSIPVLEFGRLADELFSLRHSDRSPLPQPRLRTRF